MPKMFARHASVAMNASEPPTQSGFVTQYNTAAIAPWTRPKASFTHSYGPPSIQNALPTSAMTSMYGATKTSASTTSQTKPSGPFEATVPSVSSPTKAQSVKNTMSKRRNDLINLLFSVSAKAVVCSATAMGASSSGLVDALPGFGENLTESSDDL